MIIFVFMNFQLNFGSNQTLLKNQAILAWIFNMIEMVLFSVNRLRCFLSWDTLGPGLTVFVALCVFASDK